ncbi:type II secretion system F family protein [Georgenia yuyongxinii]|uniref:Type II secretion system F family protein n=1 Tax=Georgenia yuyongxinii TaxID=2589797 RepID=A0A5B8C8T7_9MICO|nr:type II secretion system F family protein [Georgenia yuyongxinii]QDC25911.1 type II secretion system F family protein [Georgenia yuyongxinii]
MAALLVGAAGALLVLFGAQGLRLLGSTGLEDQVITRQGEEDEGPRGFAAFVDRLGARFQRTLMAMYGPARLRRLEDRLRRAGRPERLTVSAFMQRQAGFTVLGMVVVVLLALAGQALLGVIFGLVFAAWMEVWLRMVAARRRRQIDRDLPDFLDVLGVTVRAGTSFRQAVERVSAFHAGPLAEEMATALREMQLGIPRRDAFIGVRDRAQSENVSTFVTALLQAEELGVPLAEALGSISSEVRRQRAQQVRRDAAKAAPRVSLVVTMTIVPGALILMMAGMLISNLGSLGDVFG